MQTVLQFDDLPQDAIEAAGTFHRLHLPVVREAIRSGIESLVVVLPPATHDHAGWRRALVQDLARAHVPVRINFVVGQGDARCQRAVAWLAQAPGVTGQLLPTA